MNSKPLKALSIALLLSSVVLLIGWAYFIVHAQIARQDRLAMYSLLATFTLFDLLALIISFRSRQSGVNLNLALFFFSISLYIFFKFYLYRHIPGYIGAHPSLLSVFCGISFIQVCSSFSRHLSDKETGQRPASALKRSWSRALQLSGTAKYLWLLLFPLCLLLQAAALATAIISWVLIITVAVGFLVRGVRQADVDGKERIRWFLWGILTVIFLIAAGIVLSVFYTVPPLVITLINMLIEIAFLLSMIFAVFFADALNAQLAIRKTAVYGLLFLLFIFSFSVIEHLVVHQITHFLHLDDQLLIAVFSGIFSLFIKPIHERFEHFVSALFKKHKPEPAAVAGAEGPAAAHRQL